MTKEVKDRGDVYSYGLVGCNKGVNLIGNILYPNRACAKMIIEEVEDLGNGYNYEI